MLLLSCFALPVFANKRTLPDVPIATSAPIEIVLTQQELAVDVPDNSGAAMQFGLIGALVGTAISNAQVKNAEQRVAELRNLMLDYPFNDRIEQALRSKLAAGGISGDAGVRVLHSTWDADPAGMPSDGTVVMLVPRYSMLNNFELLSVKLALQQVERSIRSNGKPRQKVLFTRTYAFNFPLSKIAGSGAEEDAARWLAFGEGPLASLLDLGIDQVTDMLVYDLSSEGRQEAGLPVRGHGGEVRGLSYGGRVVREHDDWIWLRAGPGAMRTLVAHSPVDEPRMALLAVPKAPVAAEGTTGDGTPPADPADGDAPPEASPAGEVDATDEPEVTVGH
ncbi:hypothetical protein E2F46_12245 [Luteimonas aestuarii]|uniref:Uncharacterized protein n=1 Tax=Luteimonas aestuarii TaxID=453837 RepID=A0A4R5TKN6_9GAMM|nr:hypothetical protein [Luteimonas aestuarii]TDK23127.1 hypothetical protein E2F46_12245 [Luteimonas aestuarii]